MSITSSLLDLAKRYVWANPYEDKQYLIGLNRITKLRGVRNELIIPHVDVLLPTSNRTYVCYEMGSEVLEKLGIRESVPVAGWINLATLLEDTQCHISLVSEGHILLLSTCYMRRLNNGNVIFAIDLVRNAFGLKFDQRVYIRFYSFRENKGVSYTTYTKTNGNESEFNDLKVAALAAPAYHRVFRAGLLVDIADLTYSMLSTGETIQSYTDLNTTLHSDGDDAIDIGRYEVTLSNMTSYESVAGGRRKVICSLLNDVDDNVNHDDIDFFIEMKSIETELWSGLYIARLNKHTVTALTLKDFSLDATYLDHLVNVWQNSTGLTCGQTRITYILRRVSRYVKPVNDDSRIRDLSKLPIEHRHTAMAGLLATLPFWRAENLEVSEFMAWRNARLATLNIDHLPKVFSRNSAICQLQGIQWDEYHEKHRYPYTAGDLGGRVVYYRYVDGAEMAGWVRPTTVSDMEAFWINQGNLAGDVINDITSSSLPITYAMFLPDKNNDEPLDHERLAGNNLPITIPNGQGIFAYYDEGDGPTKAELGEDYSIVDAGGVYTITWSEDLLYANRWVRVAGKRIETRLENVAAETLVSGINIYEQELSTCGIARDVGMGVLLCWLNGKFLVEGIDFFVAKNDPDDYEEFDTRIFIVHCGVHLLPTGNSLELVYMGLPDDELRHVNKSRIGFVLNDLIGYDNRYDVYGDRMEIIHAGGNYIEVPGMLQEHGGDEYASQPPQPTPTVPAVYNGKPFSVTPIPSLLPEWELTDVCETEAEAIIRETLIENYLATIYPQDNSATTVVADLYDLYSPLINAVTAALLSAYIDAPYVNPSDTWIDALVNTYFANYLDIEPSLVDSTIGYVEIRPRITTNVTTISSNGLTLLQRINQRYCNNRVVGFDTYYVIGEMILPS